MDFLDSVKTMVGIEIDNTEKDALIQLLTEQATNEFLQYTNRTNVPTGASNVILDMIIVKYNLLGTEGLASQSYSGITETYANYSAPIINALNSFRKVKTL